MVAALGHNRRRFTGVNWSLTVARFAVIVVAEESSAVLWGEAPQ